MKQQILLCLCLAVVLTGCSTIVLPRYVPDKNPTKKSFHADYEEVVAATKAALESLGWRIAEETDPALYERAWQLKESGVQQILLMSDYRKSNFLIVSRNAVLNAYIRSGAEATDVELRYLRVSTYPFKTFYKYRNKKLINKLFARIDKNLQN